MARSELFRLQRSAQRFARERRRHGFAAVPVDDAYIPRAEGVRALDDVAQHRPPGERLQHFRQRGTHAGALAGGEDDNAGIQVVFSRDLPS